MTVLLVLVAVGVLASLGMCIEMSRRNEAMLGLAAIVVLMVAGVLGCVHAALAAGS